MATISYANGFTSGNTNATNPAIAITTASDCKLIVLGFSIDGNSAFPITPTLGSDSFTQIGSAIATSEGLVQQYYLVTNTANRSANVTYNNKNNIYHSLYITTYNSLSTIAYENTGNTFSTSGLTASINVTMQANTGSVCVTQYHSGYPSISGVTRNGTTAYLTDRGALIGGASYSIGTTATACNLFWSSPSADDYAMINSAFISTVAPSGSDITTRDSVGIANMTSVNSVILSSLSTINTINS